MKQVLFRDNQELQAADFNAMQLHRDAALSFAVQDAIAKGRYYADGDVLASGATELSVAPLRLYQDGVQYLSESAATLNLFAYLPLVTQRIVTVVVWGREVETLVEPRDFLIDPAGDATEPRAVAMQPLMQAMVEVVPGAESADPQAPAIMPGVLALADVLMSPTGVVSITMRTANRLPSVLANAQDIGKLNLWKAEMDPRVAALGSDLALLSERTENMASPNLVRDMATDIARLKERLDIPDNAVNYASDKFGDESESDPAYAGYAALAKLGLQFPVAAVSTAPVNLFNPIEPLIKRASDGNTILPAYSEALRLETRGYAGDTPINQYPSFPLAFRSRLWGYDWCHYGAHWNSAAYWYNRYWWNYYGYAWNYYQAQVFWRAYQTPQPDAGSVTVNGSMLAQTLLVQNSLWLTSLGLFFSAVSPGVNVEVAIVETVQGKPDPEKTLARVTLNAADLKLYPQETRLPIGPVHLEGGKRYAIVLMSGGAHRLALVDGGAYTQGTLFFGTDGDYLTGTLNKDLMFRLYAAKFERSRVEVPMQNVSLAGGITGLEIKAQSVVPDGTGLDYEIQIGGVWKRLGDGHDHLNVKPDIVPLRAVFNGTHDMMPALILNPDGLIATRPATALTHISAERTLGAATSAVDVSVWLHGFGEPTHDLSAALIIGGSDVAPASVSDKAEDGGIKRTFKFTGLSSVTGYRIKLVGARADFDTPFVILERTDVAY